MYYSHFLVLALCFLIISVKFSEAGIIKIIANLAPTLLVNFNFIMFNN